MKDSNSSNKVVLPSEGRSVVEDLKDFHCELIHDVCHSCEEPWFLEAVRGLISLPASQYLELCDYADTATLELASGRIEWSTYVRLLDSRSSCLGDIARGILSCGPDMVRIIAALHQTFTFPLRIDLPGAEQQFDSFAQINDTRDNFRPSSHLIDISRRYLDEEFATLSMSGFAPRHGPGVAGYVASDGSIRRTRRAHCEDFKDKLVDLGHFANMCFRSGITVNRTLLPLQPSLRDLAPSQVLSVPKSWKKKRLIAVEDATKMFFQQGVRAMLYRALEKHPFWRRVVDLRRAEINRRRACEGSLMRWLDTVDLTSASDTVGYGFVRSLFEHLPVWKALRAGRSSHLQIPEHGLVKNKMMATMGNAFCFPVECIVFALITLEAGEDTGVLDVPTVYGDDIVCNRKVTGRLLELLHDYGFIPNVAKTFTGDSPFRESCGGEYINGVDITPVRISRKFSGFQPTKDKTYADVLLSTVPTLRQLHQKGLKRTFRHVCRQLQLTRHKYPFSTSYRIGLPCSRRPDDRRRAKHLGYQLEGDVVDWFVAKKKRRNRNSVVALISALARTVEDESCSSRWNVKIRGYRPWPCEGRDIVLYPEVPVLESWTDRCFSVSAYLPSLCVLTDDERFLSPLSSTGEVTAKRNILDRWSADGKENELGSNCVSLSCDEWAPWDCE